MNFFVSISGRNPLLTNLSIKSQQKKRTKNSIWIALPPERKRRAPKDYAFAVSQKKNRNKSNM